MATVLVRYGSYKGLTRFKLVAFQTRGLVRYGSYKGLTLMVLNLAKNTKFIVRYGSYKGLTQDWLIVGL